MSKLGLHIIRCIPGHKNNEGLTCIILLPEKFLQFDWLRAEVFQLNLKYLLAKISYYGNQNHEIILLRELRTK